MTASRHDFDDTTRLISSLLDGTLPPDERGRLEDRLSQDAEARRIYLQMVDQEIELTCLLAPDYDRTPQLLAPVIEGESRSEPPPARRFHFISWLAAAAAVMALLAVFWPRRPDTPPTPEAIAWTASFEDGNTAGWTGTLVSEGLPAGSNFGIRSVDRSDNGAVSSQIHLPADWDRGLFSLTSRSTLHITYRHASPGGWMDIFMHTDGGHPKSQPQTEQNSMFMLRHGKFPGEPGQWQTITIPFANFVRKIPDPASGKLSFTGGPPRGGERVFNLVFGGSPGFDLTIDRIWITTEGRDTETIQSLP